MLIFRKLKKLKRVLEVFFLLLLITWIGFFLTDYIRYEKGKSPIITLKKQVIELDNGTITEYLSFGYVFRTYDLTSDHKVEMTPFWIKYQVIKSSNPYPEIPTDYPIPDNPDKLAKVDGILYFYDDDGNLIYNYRCLNSKSSCHVAYSVLSEYDYQEDIPIKQYNNYLFIDDSTSKEKIVYLVDIEHNKIVYQVSGVRASLIDSQNKGLGVNDEYIVMNAQNKYGIIKVGNNISQDVPFSYDLIKYNEQSHTYIAKAKYWMVTNFQDNIYISNTPITDVYQIDNNYYYLSPRRETVNEQDITTYRVLDSTPLAIFKEHYLYITFQEGVFFTVDSNLKLSIRNLEDQKLNSEDIQVEIDPSITNKIPFQVSKENDQIVISILRENNPIIDYYYLNPNTYQLEPQNETD